MHNNELFPVGSFQMASLGTAVIGNALSYTNAEIAFLPWYSSSNAMEITKLTESTLKEALYAATGPSNVTLLNTTE